MSAALVWPETPATTIRVLYADTDAGGVVYNATYLRFFEAGRAEAFRAGGAAYTRLTDEGLQLPVVELHIRYHAPAVYDDLIGVYVALGEVGRVRIRFEYQLRREPDGLLLASGWSLHGCVHVGSGRLARIPDWARQRLQHLPLQRDSV